MDPLSRKKAALSAPPDWSCRYAIEKATDLLWSISESAVEHDMRHMDPLGPKLPRERLSQSSESELADRKGGELGGSLPRRCGAGEEERSSAGERVFGEGLVEQGGQDQAGEDRGTDTTWAKDETKYELRVSEVMRRW
jgi:hypothetical protein